MGILRPEEATGSHARPLQAQKILCNQLALSSGQIPRVRVAQIRRFEYLEQNPHG